MHALVESPNGRLERQIPVLVEFQCLPVKFGPKLARVQ